MATETAKAAVELARWFGRQQLRVIAAARTAREDAELRRLRKLLQETRYNNKATLRELCHNHGYRKADLQRLAQKFPTALSIKKTLPGANGGRPSEIIFLQA